MNEASHWRFALAQQIGQAYAENPKARVVMVAGSTGRSSADRYSDLEIDVYWSTPPTDEERKTAEVKGKMIYYRNNVREEEQNNP